MKGKTWMWLLAAAAAVAVVGGRWSAASAQEAGAIEDFIQKSKQPVPWLTWGADARLREIFTPNLLLDKEDRHFQRYRFRLWASVKPIEDISFNARLVWEPRHFCQPSRTLTARRARVIDEWTMNEAIPDRFNVQWKNFLGLPVTITAGRQDIIFGNGWLVLDGTPLDGSRTIFFDAIRGTVNLEDWKTTVDLIYICQQADSDQHIGPLFCDKDFHNIEQDEQGVIVYVTNKSLPKTQVDAYFIYKADKQELGGKPGDVGAGRLAPWQVGTDADIYTFGARVAGDIDENWKYRAEFAKQFGNKDGRDLSAFGFNSRLSYFLNDPCNNNFRLSYEYLSGDDPDPNDRGTDTGFDPLWGRWPQFSELLAYTIALEKRPGEQTNLHRVGLGWSCNPHEKLEVCADYNLLFRDEKVDTFGRNSASGYFDNGCFKGQLLTGLLRYKINKHIAGHALAELFFPGDFYNDNRNDVAGMFRYEIVFTW